MTKLRMDLEPGMRFQVIRDTGYVAFKGRWYEVASIGATGRPWVRLQGTSGIGSSESSRSVGNWVRRTIVAHGLEATLP